MSAIQQSVQPGDVVEIHARRVGDHPRTGEVVSVLDAETHPHYLVRWEDGHESILYPRDGTSFRRSEGVRPKRGLDLAHVTTLLVEQLGEQEIEFEVLPHRRTTHAVGEARVLGVLAQTVAKTVLVRAPDGRRIRAVVPASSRLDLAKLARAVDTTGLVLLTESELVAAYPEFELGAVPPFGGPDGEHVVVDAQLATCDHVVLEAGAHDASLRLRTDDLLRLADAQLADIAMG